MRNLGKAIAMAKPLFPSAPDRWSTTTESNSQNCCRASGSSRALLYLLGCTLVGGIALPTASAGLFHRKPDKPKPPRTIQPVIAEPAGPSGPTMLWPASQSERALWERLNQARVAAGAARLRWNDRLMQAARKHAAEMLQRQSLSHQFAGEPDLAARVAATGVHFDEIGENVAYAPDPETMHINWMNSPGHRQNILNPRFDEGGIGVVSGPDHRLYGVQAFARVIPEMTPDDVEDLVLNSLNRMRSQKGEPGLTRLEPKKGVPSGCPLPRNFVDAMPDVSKKLPRNRSEVHYSTSDPRELPEGVRKIAAASGTAIFISACAVRDDASPQGMWHIAIEY